LRRVRRRKSTRTRGFVHGGIQRSVFHIAGDASGGGGALFDSCAATGRENNHRGASGIINGEGQKKFPFDVDLLFDQNGFDWKLPDRHFQHARRVTAHLSRFPGEGHAANAGASGSPGLDLDDHRAALHVRDEFPGRRYGIISG